MKLRLVSLTAIICRKKIKQCLCFVCLSAFRALHGLDAFKLPPLLKVFYFVKNSTAVLQSGLLDLLCSVSNHLVCYQLGLS